MENKLEMLDKKIETKENELSKIDENITQLQKKRGERNEELVKLKNERAACQMEEINLVLGEKGLKLTDILKAVKTGNLESINKKIGI